MLAETASDSATEGSLLPREECWELQGRQQPSVAARRCDLAYLKEMQNESLLGQGVISDVLLHFQRCRLLKKAPGTDRKEEGELGEPNAASSILPSLGSD